MLLHLGADHGGYVLKNELKAWLQSRGYAVQDHGAYAPDPEDDFPVFGFAVARAVVASKNDLGILICRSGAGMMIAANRILGCRAVQCRTVAEVVHAREHDHATVIGLAGDDTPAEVAKNCALAFLTAEPDFTEKRLRRIALLDALDESDAE